MSEKQEQQLELDLEVDQEVQEETPDFSDVELEAMEQGWNPEGVEGKKNLTAEEFLDRKPLYDKIHATEKRMKQILEGMEALKQHNATIAERERAKVIAELKAAKKIALENENYDAVVEIDDKIAEETARKNEPVSNDAFIEWVSENDWYNQDPEMKDYADMIGTGYAGKYPNKQATDVYQYVSQEVKKRFPEKFGNVNRTRPNPVEGAGKGRTGTSKKYSAKDLPETDRQIMRTIVRSGIMSEQDYLKQYFS